MPPRAQKPTTPPDPPEQTGELVGDQGQRPEPDPIVVDPNPDEGPDVAPPTELTPEGEDALQDWAAKNFNPREIPWPGY